MIWRLAQMTPGTWPAEPLNVVVSSSVEGGANNSWWQNVPLLAVMATILVALIAAWASLRQHTIQRAGARAESLSVQYGEAMADAVAWIEIPWRIARRVGDDPETVAGLVAHIHALQERVEHHRRWLCVESEGVGAAYADLARATKTAAADAIKSAWLQAPSPLPAQQAAVALAYEPDIAADAADFLVAARRHIDEVTRVRWIRSNATTGV